MKELFTIDKENGEIVTKVRLDREEKKVCEFFFKNIFGNMTI